MVTTKTKDNWMHKYHIGWETQAEVMRKLKLNSRSCFYREFHHYIIRKRDKS